MKAIIILILALLSIFISKIDLLANNYSDTDWAKRSLSDARAEYYLENCIMFAESNNFIKALKQCRSAIVHKPDYAEAYYEMCNIYLAMKKYAEDHDSCKQVFNINPNYQYDSILLDEISHYEECNRYLVVEGYAEATDACKQAVTINPEYTDALIMLDKISKEEIKRESVHTNKQTAQKQ